jgi:hypothetical protein
LNEAGHEASIEEGGKGQYDVLAEGELVFSKQEEGRFPEHPEISALLSDAEQAPREETEEHHRRPDDKTDSGVGETEEPGGQAGEGDAVEPG